MGLNGGAESQVSAYYTALEIITRGDLVPDFANQNVYSAKRVDLGGFSTCGGLQWFHGGLGSLPRLLTLQKRILMMLHLLLIFNPHLISRTSVNRLFIAIRSSRVLIPNG